MHRTRKVCYEIYYLFILDTFKRAISNCLDWTSMELKYPNYITDVIIFSECDFGQEQTLQKVLNWVFA